MQNDQRRLLILSSLGGVLEFYDFIIFAIFAGYISHAFFPLSNRLSGLMVAFATFAIGYLVRPLGGIVFGHFGDRIGRKKTFTISILMMAVATLGIGIFPDYEHIGMAAPIAVILLRILQGFSIGGEIPGAITYVSEALAEQKGLGCGIIFFALTMGIVLGSLVNALMNSFLSDSQMQAFGWRVPFVLGGIFGLFSYLLRRGLHESTAFLTIERSIERYPIIEVFRQKLFAVMAGIFITALCAVIVTSLFLFTPAYFNEVLHLPANAYIWQKTLAIGAGSFLSIFFGYVSDVFSPRRLLLILIGLTAALAYPIFLIYVHYKELYYLAMMASSLLLGFSAGVIPRVLSELFPTQLRYSGIALSYNLGFAFFGGLTPFISLSLIYYSGWLASPSIYLLIVSALAILSFFFIPVQHSSHLQSEKKFEAQRSMGS
ncbi:MFS transporter [Legionella jordanis]|uniref:Major facilitator family transporter n=1 Tax=Legionella jordanis TaxID=456 RepID=A0A0W0VDA5_9GAMM|nr:MFS transporter [Legionella jordanis]KTD18072.1 major facilitator family transporter [Legionella jordanis]RMX02242.1 MFS transporter [Legionella jordanis]RMX21272.1 MFS transporter [Legionella jordanis]VEH13836.1 Major facilitator family transporter [Legionella jordanis]